MNDDAYVQQVLSLAKNERAIGYDESLAQYMLLGDGYLINLNPDGTYASERKNTILQWQRAWLDRKC